MHYLFFDNSDHLQEKLLTSFS